MSDSVPQQAPERSVIPSHRVPQQLLPSVTTFVGRVAELRLLDDLGSQPSRLLVLVGPPGVGKTTLAAHWARQIQDQFTDGQLHMDLGGPSAPAPVTKVLGQLLRALNVPAAQVPIDAIEQSALLRSLTSDRRLLVILDDAVTAEQVRVLLPASQCSLTIVTSRSRLPSLVASGARFVDVAPLPTDDGVSLLTQLVGHDRIQREMVQAQQLVNLCAGLPLALCVAGARLMSRSHRPVERAVWELLDERIRLARLSLGADLSVEAVFDVSYQALSSTAARLYRLLGLHPGPEFEVGVAAAALGGSVLQAEDLLEELMTASLVNETSANRFRFHDLVRLHAGQQAESTETVDERSLASRRMLDWYLHAATAAGELTTPHRTDVRRDIREMPFEPVVFQTRDGALDWLDRERGNLLAAARLAVTMGWPAVAWQLAEAMWGLFLYRTYYDDWLQFDLIAVRATRNCADRAAEAGARDRIGSLYHAIGQNAKALIYFREAFEIWREIGDRHRLAGSMERFGFIYLDEGEIPVALEHFESALVDYRELGEDRSVGLALISIGRALIEEGQPAKAMLPLVDAVAVLEGLSVPDSYNTARARLALGRAEMHAGQHDDALARLSSVLTTMQSLNSPLGEADATFVLGEIFQRLGDFQRARIHYERTERIWTELGNPGVKRARKRIRELDELRREGGIGK